jgi:serine protease
MRRGGDALWLGVLGFLLTTLPAAASTPAQTGRILVSLKDDRPHARVAARAATAISGPRVPQIGLVTVRPLAGVSQRSALRALRADPRVRAAVPEGRFRLRYRPNDAALRVEEPDGNAPEGTSLQWPLERQGLLGAWDVTRGSGARVAIIDTGIDATHPDLAGKIAATVDLDGGEPEPATEDADGHGTHVASLACAATDNGIGIAGAGFDCSLIVIKTDLTDASVAASIVAAADHGAHAINMSFGDEGDEPSPAIADAIDYAIARGSVVVAAAADAPVAEQGEPANLLQPSSTGPDLSVGKGLTVTAADARDRRADFAGRGGQISLAAYGALRSTDGVRGLFAAYPANGTAREGATVLPPSTPCNCRATLDGDTRWAFLPGTSMAAPQVAAIAALVRNLNPDLGPLEVVRLIKETARRPAGSAWEPELGWGIVDAGAAVEVARSIDRRPPASRLRARRAGASAVLRWSGSDAAAPGLIASGVAAYDVYRAVNGGRARRIARRSGRRLTVRLKPGLRYAFHTVAVDHAGNREAAPSRPDAVLSRRRALRR